jgi:hypothetical protein
MGARASAFYAERRSEEAGVPVVVAVIAIFTAADIGTGKWISAAIFLIVVSGLLTLTWFGYHR